MSYILKLKKRAEKLNKYIIIFSTIACSLFLFFLFRFIILLLFILNYFRSMNIEYRSISVRGLTLSRIIFKDVSYKTNFNNYQLLINAKSMDILPRINTRAKIDDLTIKIDPSDYVIGGGSEPLFVYYNFFDKSIKVPKNELLVYFKDKNSPIGKIANSDSNFVFKNNPNSYFLSMVLNSKLLFNEKPGNPVVFVSDFDFSYNKKPLSLNLISRKIRIGEKRFTTDLTGEVKFYEGKGLSADFVMWMSNVNEIFDELVESFIKISNLYGPGIVKNDNIPRQKVYIMYSKIVRNLIDTLKKNERKIENSTSKSLLIDMKTDEQGRLNLNRIDPNTLLSIILNDYKNS